MIEARIGATTREQREVFRARIILLAAEGGSTRSIAHPRYHAADGERLGRQVPLRPGSLPALCGVLRAATEAWDFG